jgi:hypothetical protein
MRYKGVRAGMTACAVVVLIAGLGSAEMSEERTFTVQEAHRWFAIEFNNTVWSFIENTDRTEAEAERMIHMAHASVFHWLEAGTLINHARGEYLVSRAYAAADRPEAALRHALRCMQLTEDASDEAKDWDVAFSFEAVARAYAISGKMEDARTFIERAERAGDEIADADDRKIFEGELGRQPWNGLR